MTIKPEDRMIVLVKDSYDDMNWMFCARWIEDLYLQMGLKWDDERRQD